MACPQLSAQLPQGRRNGTVVHVHFEGKPTGKIRWLDIMPDRLATWLLDNMQDLNRVLDTEAS